MFQKTIALILTVSVLLACVSAAAAETGLFGELSRGEGADERLALLEEVAGPVAVSVVTDEYSVEVSQAYYEGDRVFVSYRTSGARLPIQDGLSLSDGSYADIIAGEEIELENGSVIGWKECVVPEGTGPDARTFSLVFGKADAERVSFTLNRAGFDHLLQGASAAESCPARAELYVGKVDMKGTVRLVSPEQAASWRAWQEGEEETGTDVIVCWNLYRNGELVSGDLYGASCVNDPDEIVFEVMFPLTDDVTGLSLVPEYSEGGENPAEAITLTPAVQP